MFDRLIESEPAGAEFANRRRCFMVSSLVGGVVFLAAVVFSIYAAEVGIGSSDLELTEMLAPMAAAEPERRQTEPPQPRSVRAATDIPARQANIARVDELPSLVPIMTSAVPNAQMARQSGAFRLDLDDWTPANSGTSGRNQIASSGPGTGLSPSTAARVDDPTTGPAPPPPPAARPKRPDVIRSIGVVNGKATYLPKPPYPPAAASLGIQGKVDVQVTINESGIVLSASAVSGHPFLRAPAERAARQARFTPTLLSDQPVKVTGIITYNFTK